MGSREGAHKARLDAERRGAGTDERRTLFCGMNAPLICAERAESRTKVCAVHLC